MGEDHQKELAKFSHLVNSYLLGSLLILSGLVGCSRPMRGLVVTEGGIPSYGGSGTSQSSITASENFQQVIDKGFLSPKIRHQGEIAVPPKVSVHSIVRTRAQWRQWCKALGHMSETLSDPTFPGSTVVCSLLGRAGGALPVGLRVKGKALEAPLITQGKAGSFVCEVYNGVLSDIHFVEDSLDK